MPRFIAAGVGDATWSDQFGMPGVNGYVYTIAVDNSNNIYADNAYSMSKWNGTSWYDYGRTFNGGTSVFAFDSSGKLYAGGSFTMADGVPANRIAKWDGTSWGCN